MIKPPILSNEEARLQELKSLDLLDTQSEQAFDEIVKLASYITGCPISLISLIDSDRQWFKAKVGLAASQTHRDISFCGHTIESDNIFIIENALEDDRFKDNPLVTLDPSIRFYAGQPLITKNGFRIGTLCAIDRIPKKLTDEQKDLLASLGRQASYLIEKRIYDKKQNALKNQIESLYTNLKITQKNIELLFKKTQVIVAFMKGPEHRFEYVNPAHIKLLNGVDATGKTVSEMQPETVEDGALKLLDEVYHQGKTISLTDTPFKVGNAIRYFNFIYTPSYGEDNEIDGVMAIVNDITPEKDLQQKLSMAIDISKVGFYEWDIVKDVVIYSEQMQSDWGITKETPIIKALELIHPDDRDKTIALINESIANKTNYQTEYRVVRADGRTIWVDARGKINYNEDNQALKFIGTSVDITNQVEIRNEISRSLETLKEERDLRESFVAALTHDMRTPLTSARMSAQLLKSKTDESVHHIIGRIIGSMDRADDMIRDLLDASKIKVGEKLSFDIEELNLNSLAQNTIDDLSSIYGNRFNFMASKNITGHWDQDALRRILENLTNNALKYGSSDSPITIAINHNQDRLVEISVHNMGNPIQEEDPMSLFAPYKRSMNTNAQKGWGIGLTLVRGFTESMGGMVKVSSSQQDGTLFSIILPEDSRKFIN